MPDRRVVREEVVRNRADAVIPEPLAGVIGRERLVGKSEIHGPEPAAAVREGGDAAGVLDELLERLRADESGKLTGAGLAHLRATFFDRRPIEIDDVAHGPSVRAASAGRLGA